MAAAAVDDDEVNRSLMARAVVWPSSEVDSRGDVSDKGPPAPARPSLGLGRLKSEEAVSQRAKPLSSSPSSSSSSSSSSRARSASESVCLRARPRPSGSFRHLLISNYDFVK